MVKTESRGKCLRRGIGPMHIRNLESGRRRVAAVLERKSGRSADRERQATCPGRFPHTMHGEEARLELPLCNRPAIWSLSPAPPARKRTAHPSLHGESGLQPSHPQPLGQHGPNRRARLCRTVALGLGRTARHILRQI